MTYTAKVTLKFDSTWEYSAGIYDDEMVPEQHITIKVPAEDLNSLHILSEDFAKEVNKLNAEIWDLKAKISRLEQPENPQYTDEEMDAMTFQEWGHLIPGSYAAVQNGCKCPVMDNEEMPDDKKWVNGDCPLHGKKNEN